MLIFLPIILLYYAQDFAYYSSMPAYYSTIMLVKINDNAGESQNKCSFQSMFLLAVIKNWTEHAGRKRSAATDTVMAEATASGFYAHCPFKGFFFANTISSVSEDHLHTGIEYTTPITTPSIIRLLLCSN